MDYSRFIPPDTTHDVPGEALPLVQNTIERSPYQAYCETATSSSRSSSSRSLMPSPLRIRRHLSSRIANDSQPSGHNGSDQNTLLIQAAASAPGSYIDVVTLLKTGEHCKTQTQPANCDTLTESAISNHITRAVTPRGSHLLALETVTACDVTPSHPRIQQVGYTDCTTTRTISRKPILRDSGTYYRPLPPLPPGEDPFKDDHSAGDVDDQEEFRQIPSQITTLNGSPKSTYRIKRRPLPSQYDCVASTVPSENFPIKAKHSSGSLQASLRPYHRNSSGSLRQDVLYDRAQSIAADASHIPRGHWSDVDNYVSTSRLSQPNIAMLKYKAGQLSPHTPDISPPTPPHRATYTQRTDYFPQQPSTPPAYIHSTQSSLDTQNGPRPPPWGSYDALEMQRRQRSEARETRLQKRGGSVRLRDDTGSTHQKSYSTETLVKEAAREVEVYREQILGVYPDMEFDGEAGAGGRGTCWCVLM
ncbi:hypothetical protein PtrM4_002760 [Pyrenophora tritici-repentis]|uniref:Uncharacterized protein n=1 Tax=Pyrenophora tritici-repentis TaxID=45151 RepID=A0A317AB37_9PLEO|nr:hypothetical protein A1F99_002470 [Pyrenophora tritici-repentis]KAF7576036.1 hypothetical protein PtrM4_002760 [Pyrenophora tritici-repentis]KAI1519893.1 hypothetical protein Ptr86124_000261 [Pyrenophora tritici-repentis]KAI1675724.1 hypothetical protein L13192_02471 [Pyrenophora tritici-repentis]KAI1687111.1 hypothetical protein KJE20_00288 [Pyrenophora tritici-repentis]